MSQIWTAIIASMILTACSSGFQGSDTTTAGSTDTSSTSGSTDSGSNGNATPTPTATPVSGGSTKGVVAVSANRFLNSTGVNTHNDQGYSYNNYIAPLQYLGIRNVRDGIRNVNGLMAMNKQAGVKFAIGAYGDLTTLISTGKTLAAANALLAFEGPNEPNNFTFSYGGATGGGSGSWVPVANYQRDMYAAVKADATLAKYPVFGVSEEGAETSNLGLQFTVVPTGAGTLVPDGTKYSDYVNIHNYVSSNQNKWVDNMAWNAASPTLNAQWDGLYTEVGVTWSKHYQGYTNAQLLTVPRVTTETGWDNNSNQGGDVGQAVVLSNTFLSQFKQGWAYTFIYELVDGEGSDGTQGLYTSKYQPKTVATYIHNLTTILADTADIASPGKVDYSIANQPATVHDLLLQKNDGTFELVVWDERSDATVDSVTVNLGATYSSVKVYDIASGTTATKTLSSVNAVPLSLNNHAMILELK